MRLIKKAGIKYYRLFYLLKYKNIRLASNTKVLPGSFFGGFNSIGAKSTFYGRMGHDSYIGSDSFIYANIGKYTSIGDRVYCIFASHPTSVFVSSSPVFYSTANQNGHSFVSKNKFEEVLLQDGETVPVIIGNDVWIGSDVRIIGKVTIHDGAVLASGSVVTKDVMPYSIVGGVPAKEIKKRFDEDTIKRLLSIEWWNKDQEWIEQNAEFFSDVSLFLDRFDTMDR